MNHAIVTGATGFAGVHLVAELLSRGAAVTALCRKGSPRLGRLPADVRVVYDMDALPPADVFYHLGWEGASGPGRADAFLQARNVQLTLEALQRAAGLGCKKFVGLGTVYERLVPQILSADSLGGPDFYILSKAYAGAMADKLARKLGIPFIWCRVCHPIGKYIKAEQLMAYTVSSLLSGDPPSFGPALTPFDIIAAEDLAAGLYLAGERGKRREYCIGSGVPRPLREYLGRVREVLGVSTPLSVGARPDDGLRFDYSWFDIAPLAEDTGYTPGVDFDAAVTRTADWIKG